MIKRLIFNIDIQYHYHNNHNNQITMTRKRVYKKCAPGKKRNPATNRCKKVTSGVHAKKSANETLFCDLSQTDVRRMIVFFGMSRDLNMSDIPTPAEPNKLCKTFKKMFKSASCIKNWEIVKYIDSGAHGQVYSCRHADGRRGVVKIQYGDSQKVADEIRIQKLFHKKNSAPEIFDHCSFSPKVVMGKHWEKIAREIGEDVEFSDSTGSRRIHLIFMEKIDGVLTSWLKQKQDKKFMKAFLVAFVVLLNTLRKNKLTHSDLHQSNLGYKYLDSKKLRVELVPIDFGLAMSNTANTELEILKFLRTIHFKFINIHPDNHRYLFNSMRRIASKVYNIHIPTSQTEIEERYMNLRY